MTNKQLIRMQRLMLKDEVQKLTKAERDEMFALLELAEAEDNAKEVSPMNANEQKLREAFKAVDDETADSLLAALYHLVGQAYLIGYDRVRECTPYGCHEALMEKAICQIWSKDEQALLDAFMCVLKEKEEAYEAADYAKALSEFLSQRQQKAENVETSGEWRLTHYIENEPQEYYLFSTKNGAKRRLAEMKKGLEYDGFTVADDMAIRHGEIIGEGQSWRIEFV